MEPFEQIEQFYRKVVQLPIPQTPTRLTHAQKLSAVEHWDEEHKEFLEAETLEDEIDACIDLAWLALGRVIEMGASLPDHFAEVVRANMDRVPGRNPKRPLSTGFDAVKPEGWRGPDHTAILVRHAAAMIEEGMTDAGKATQVRKRIILVGHGRHGKDTAAEMLRDRYGYRFTSSSLFCAEKVMLPLFEYEASKWLSQGVPVYADAAECFADRHGSSAVGDHRTFWFEGIKAYCIPDKARLAREIFAEHDMYVGIRDSAELFAAQQLGNVVTIWVDASNRLPPEQGSSMNIEPTFADHVLDNNGTLENLSANLERLMENLA